MEQINKILTAFQMRNWYAVAALVLMFGIQFVRSQSVPLLTVLWNRVPNGWRWVGPMIVGGATAFTAAFTSGATLAQAVFAVVGGLLGISVPAMGWHAVAKESPLPIDGGAGGVST